MVIPTLKQQTFHGILWMAAGTGSQQLLSFLLFIILARTLDPISFGIIGIAMVFIDMSSLISRAGLSEVLIQKQKLTQQHKDTVFWTSLTIGGLLTLILFVAAKPIATFFATPELEFTLQMLAPACIIYAAGTSYEAILRQSFGFRALATRNVSATLLSGVFAVALALTGFGLLSLVAQRLIYATWLTASMIYATRWLPGTKFSWSICKSDLAKGTNLAAAGILNNGNLRAIDLIIGYFLGLAALGYYRIAWRGLEMLLELTTRPIGGVILSSLSKLQDNPLAMRKAYIQLIQLNALVLYPIFLGVGVVAPFFITTLFGQQWSASAPLMQIFTLMAFGIPLIWFNTNILIANNKMRQVLEINIFEFITSLIIALLLTPFGLAAAAAGNVIRVLLITPIVLWLIQRHTGTSATETLRAVVPAAFSTFIMVITLYGLKFLFIDFFGEGFGINLFLIACGSLVYPLTIYLVFPKFWDDTIKIIKSLLQK